MNIERLEIIAQWLEGEAEVFPDHRFDMNQWSLMGNSHGCKTSCCIGGAVVSFFGDDKIKTAVDPITYAGELLGMDRANYWELFYPENFALYSVDAFDASKVVTNLIKTGHVDWSII